MGRTRARRLLVSSLVVAILVACAGERRVHPPPEGEWLEWEPKKSESPKKKPPPPPEETKPAGKSKKEKKLAEPDDPKTKPAPTPVTCSGQDVIKEVFCLAQTEIGAVECPDKIPKIAPVKAAGVVEMPPRATKRDPSVEESSKQCCYAWCVKVPAVALDTLACKAPEVSKPLFCFQAPASGTKTPAAGEYGECPAGLKKTTGKGPKRSIPAAGFSAKDTKEERVSSSKACCYESCKKP